MNKHPAADSDTTDSPKAERRPYVAPTVTDFFQPIVALGSTPTDLCAAPKPPKH
ncbi:MAG: hypothetical protein WDO69_22005 [Pseudomonadota bacterium]